MAESEGIKKLVNQAAAQAAKTDMMALGDAKAWPWPNPVVSHREPWRQRHNRPILVSPVFNWGYQDRYTELMNFKMVTNILETKVYEITEEEKVPVIKNWLDQEDLQLI